MVITHVNANVLGTFLDETARILQHVEGLTTSAFPTTDWPAAGLPYTSLEYTALYHNCSSVN